LNTPNPPRYATAHNRQTSMPPVGLEPTISAGKRPQTYTLDRTDAGTGNLASAVKIKVSYLSLASTADSSVFRLALRAQLNRTVAIPTEIFHVQSKVTTGDNISVLVRGKEWMGPKCQM
jgi:hypothetical protein